MNGLAACVDCSGCYARHQHSFNWGAQEARALPEFGWVGTGLEFKKATHSGVCIVGALGPRGSPVASGTGCAIG